MPGACTGGTFHESFEAGRARIGSAAANTSTARESGDRVALFCTISYSPSLEHPYPANTRRLGMGMGLPIWYPTILI
eukprot:scaffold36328_cov133-Skeletonema_dohrnii-CCMP3373.AAC.1